MPAPPRPSSLAPPPHQLSDPAFVHMGNHDTGGIRASTFASDGKILGSVDLAPKIAVICQSPEQAREIAQAFIDCGGLMEARAREAATCTCADEAGPTACVPHNADSAEVTS